MMVMAEHGPIAVSYTHLDVYKRQFESHAAMVAAFNEPRYLEIIRPDEDLFLDRDGCLTFVTRPLIHRES